MSEKTPDTPPTTESSAPTVSSWRNPWLFVALAAIALAGWQWVETRQQLAATQAQVAKRIAEAEAADLEAKGALKVAQEQVAAQQAKLGALEAKLAEFQGQTAALQGLYQDLSRSRDEAALAEIEQSVTLAAQQLQLAGNVSAAVLSLQVADARLARLDRPQFIPLRKTLGRDLDRLRALPLVDVPGMSLRLENLILGVDKLALAQDERPRPAAEARAAADPEAAWWQRLGQEVWAEIKGLVRIQRFDRAELVLLAPGQSFFLRENLKLRLLNARLALLSRDQWTYRNELKVAQEWLGRHFDGQDKAVQSTQAALRQLSSAELNIELPNLNESLTALRSFRPVKEKK